MKEATQKRLPPKFPLKVPAMFIFRKEHLEFDNYNWGEQPDCARNLFPDHSEFNSLNGHEMLRLINVYIWGAFSFEFRNDLEKICYGRQIEQKIRTELPPAVVMYAEVEHWLEKNI